MRSRAGSSLISRISARLERVRVIRGLSISDFACMADVDARVMSAVLSGTSDDDFGFDELESLARGVEIDVVEFVSPVSQLDGASGEN